MKFLIKQFLEPPLTVCSLDPSIFFSTLFLKMVTRYKTRYGSAYFDQFYGNNRFSVFLLFTCISRDAFVALCATWVSTSDATTAKRSCVNQSGFTLTRLDGCYGDVISYTRHHGNLFTREGSTIGWNLFNHIWPPIDKLLFFLVSSFCVHGRL